MDGYNAHGVEDDRLKQVARRILDQYRLEQSNRSEDSAAADASQVTTSLPDNINVLRLSLDEMSMRIEQVERLMANRENLFMATLERIERNQAKSDGLLDALSLEVAKIASVPALSMDAIAHGRKAETAGLIQEFSSMISLGRTLLDEAREIYAASVSAAEESRKSTAAR